MFKTSLLIVLVLTVLVRTGMRWREERVAAIRPLPARRPGLAARGKAGLNNWFTAAAIAVLLSMVILGGLEWLRVWRG